jgi:hypothetical protein
MAAASGMPWVHARCLIAARRAASAGGDLMDGDQQRGPHGRCQATAKNSGEQCRNHCAPYSVVCRVHGGAAGQVKRKAAQEAAEAGVMQV